MSGGAQPFLRRLTSALFVLLVVPLPALVGFRRIEAEPSRAEVERVAHAVAPDEAKLPEALVMYYGLTLPADAVERFAEAPETVTIKARLAGLLATFAISGLVYVLLLVVRGRATAVCGCLVLCLLPPVAMEGHVLRPEQNATLFGLLAVVLLAVFPTTLRDRRPGVIGWIPRLGLITVVGSTISVAYSSVREAWVYLTVPAGALLVSVMGAALLFPRGARGRPFILWPFRAAARRYTPWMLVVLASFGLTLVALSGADGREIPRGSYSGAGLFPESLPVRWPLYACLVVGVLRMGIGGAFRLNRIHRVRGDTILLIYVAALLIQHALTPDRLDRLPASAATACLAADGAMTILILGLGVVARRNARANAAPS